MVCTGITWMLSPNILIVRSPEQVLLGYSEPSAPFLNLTAAAQHSSTNSSLIWRRKLLIRYDLQRSGMPHLFQDDVDVTSNKLGNLLPFSGLHRVVALLVLAEILHTHTIWNIIFYIGLYSCEDSNHSARAENKDLLWGLIWIHGAC